MFPLDRKVCMKRDRKEKERENIRFYIVKISLNIYMVKKQQQKKQKITEMVLFNYLYAPATKKPIFNLLFISRSF